MQRITKAQLLQEEAINIRNNKRTIGFVPTMGALHEGHLSLIERAKSENNVVICSVFVNPSQFNESSDFKSYPRDLNRDSALLESVDCDILFAPNINEIYPEPDRTIYELGKVSKALEGEHRPGHFNGVASVVKRLFELAKPHRAYFGLKDYQQYLIIKTLVEIYDVDTEVLGCEIARSERGLALSSRNLLLSAKELHQAPSIYAAMNYVKDHLDVYEIPELEKIGEQMLANEGFEVEYFSIRNSKTLEQPVSSVKENLIVLVAARLGKVRLIDNLILRD